MEPYTPRYAKPTQSISNRILRWLIPIILLAVGAAVGVAVGVAVARYDTQLPFRHHGM